ncbi:MAG: BamA/TamA family outer membrane protein [Gemmatimonadota bacterium]
MIKRTALFLFALANAAAGQQTPEPLTDQVIQAAIDLYNRAGTIRMTGDSRIAAGSEVIGDLAVMSGVLELEGRIRGDLLVLNGDLRFGPSGQVDGLLLVIGGTADRLDSTRVAGTVSVYRTSFGYQLRDGVMERVTRRVLPPELAAGRDFEFGRVDLIVATPGDYNRVEGLPISAGPRLTLGHSNPTVFEALGMYRSATGARLDADDLGFALRAEQYLGGRRALRVGARVYSEIAAIEPGGLSDREAALATFVLHRDYRDHYSREGWQGYVRFAPPEHAWSGSVEYTDERHGPVTPRDPWSILKSGDEWRNEPLAASGYLRSLAGSLAFDTRNQPTDPSHGWWLRGEIERGLGGSLRTVLDGVSETAPRRFWHGEIDVRRYARLGPSSRLAVRLLATGSITGDALPVQRQHTLGGEGSLPGFELRRFDCGGQNHVVTRNGSNFQRFYGCDHAALIQLEYQTDFTFLRRIRSSSIDQLGLLQRTRAALFFDAGRAWNLDEQKGVRDNGNDDFSADAGFGIRLGPVGLYWAVPVSGRGEPMNFFVRIGPRL